MKKLFLAMAVMGLLTGCSTKIPEYFQLSLETPAPSESIIYYIGNVEEGEYIHRGDFFENDKIVAIPSGVKYFASHTVPGDKIIRHANSVEGEVRFHAEAGKRYFVYRECFKIHYSATGVLPALLLQSATASYQIYEIDEENAIHLLRFVEWKAAKNEK